MRREADEEAPGSSPGIFKGAPVIVQGLKSAAEYNGAKGTVTSGLWDNGRYEVTLPQQGAEEPKVLALKPANFTLDTDALQEYVLQKRAESSRRSPPLEDVSLVWAKGKGLSSKAVSSKTAEVPALQQGEILLRVDKFAFGSMAMGYLMKGFTRSFGAYHSFYRYPEDGLYRSACWGYATVLESSHPKVAAGTRVYGLLPPCKFQVMPVGGIIPRGKHGEPAVVEVTMEGIDYRLNRFQELEVVDASAPSDPQMEEWKMVSKELYTMAFYMDENLLVDTGMINSVLISCASSKTALALAYCLRMRDMRLVVGLTSQEPLGFEALTGLAERVGESYYRFNDLECRDLKATLRGLEGSQAGRVRLSSFYQKALVSHWRLTERPEYLRALGALDETDPKSPQVILSNYVMARPNCLQASGLYAICCRNTCEDLMAHLEREIGHAKTTPARVSELVAALPPMSGPCKCD